MSQRSWGVAYSECKGYFVLLTNTALHWETTDIIDQTLPCNNSWWQLVTEGQVSKQDCMDNLLVLGICGVVILTSTLYLAYITVTLLLQSFQQTVTFLKMRSPPIPSNKASAFTVGLLSMLRTGILTAHDRTKWWNDVPMGTNEIASPQKLLLTPHDRVEHSSVSSITVLTWCQINSCFGRT